MTSSSSGTASKGNNNPCTHAVEHTNRKLQALKKDPDIEKTSNSTLKPTESEGDLSCKFADGGVTQNSGQPCSVANDSCEEPATSHNTPIHSSSLFPPSPHAGELLVSPTKQESGSTTGYGQPITQEIALTQIPETKGSVPSFNDAMPSSFTSRPSQLQSWNTVLKKCSSLPELESFIQSQPPEVLTLKDAVQGKTLCHALVGLIDEGFTSSNVIHLLESFEKDSLQQCMACRDSSGNTPLHCSMDVPNGSSSIVEYLLRYTSHESLLVLNNDNLTPLELSFERKLWSIFKMLLDHYIEAGASCAELFKQYVLKAAKKEGGACFLSSLLELRDRHCSHLDLNFGSSESSRTPWWYLVYSTTDVNAMNRVLQALRKHSIEFKSLLTHTDGEKNLIEEAMEKNKALFDKIQRFAKWQHSEEDQSALDKEGLNISAGSPETQSRPSSYSFQAVAGDELSPDILPLEKTTIHVQEQNFDSTVELPPSAGEPPITHLQPIQTGSLAELPKDMSQSSSESLSDGGMTSLDADDSSDGKKYKKSMPGTVQVLTQIPDAKTSVPIQVQIPLRYR